MNSKRRAGRRFAEAPWLGRWKLDEPIITGYYWHEIHGIMQIVEIFKQSRTLFVARAGRWMCRKLRGYGGNWLGPIPAPSSPRCEQTPRKSAATSGEHNRTPQTSGAGHKHKHRPLSCPPRPSRKYLDGLARTTSEKCKTHSSRNRPNDRTHRMPTGSGEGKDK